MAWRWANFPLPPQNLLALALGAGFGILFAWNLPLAAGWRCGIGLPLVALGVGMIGWSVAAAGDRRIETPGELITTGPYGLSRNPMYLGWTLLHLGVGLLANSGWIILLAIPASIATHFLDVRREEQSLEDEFGEQYRRYKRRVRRYL